MKRAVVLFNLGGPDSLDAVRPFLFNLFNDQAIFHLPQPFRSWIASFVAKRRAPVAVEIYRHLGGGSPLLANTQEQARALHLALGGRDDTRVFIAMRYWHPFTAQTVADVRDWGPDEIVLLPLYPQFSTTTTESSLKAWRKTARFHGLKAPTKTVCCYSAAPGLIDAMAELIAPALTQAMPHGKPRLLLSAHGLPESVVKGGDPYQV
jgi:protoporphyrin/coproporphyrin ferrochelatase